MYMGSGTAGRPIGVGVSPLAYVIVMPDATEYAVHRSSFMTKRSYRFLACDGTGDAIGPLGTYSFPVGPSGPPYNVNLNAYGVVYHYVAFQPVDGEMAVGAYVGNGGDNRNITVGAGWQPVYVIVKSDGLYPAVHRTASLGGDSTLYFSNLGNSSNRIQALQSTGFQVGSDLEVNRPTFDCFWMAFSSAYTAVRVTSFKATGLDDRVLVEWQTETEVDTAGFNVLRAEEPGGPWVKLNQDLIPSRGNSWQGASYDFSDQTREPGKVYWYCVEEVSTKGGTTRYPAQLVWDYGLTDADGDRMPDAWEQPLGIDTGNGGDAEADADGDGATNLAEYLAGTSPVDAQDRCQLWIEWPGGTNAPVLTWPGRAGRIYRVESADSVPELLGGASTVFYVKQATSSGAMQLESLPGAEKGMSFYRLIISPPQ